MKHSKRTIMRQRSVVFKNGLTAPIPTDRLEGEHPEGLSDEPIKPLKLPLHGKKAASSARLFKLVAALATLVWPSHIVTSSSSPSAPTDRISCAQDTIPDLFDP